MAGHGRLGNPRRWAWLNGRGHGRWLALLVVVALAHFAEHVAQMVQVHALGWSAAASQGALGLLATDVGHLEWLHWTYNALLLTGLVALVPGMSGRALYAWAVALVLQSWHLAEHTLLTAQEVVGGNVHGADHHVGLLELVWMPLERVDLHFVYNAVVFVPLVLGVLWHVFAPTRDDPLVTPCRCAVQRRLRRSGAVVPRPWPFRAGV